MYLSQVMLNVNRRDTMRALASPQMLHGAIECSFAADGQRKLWRIDWRSGKCYLLLLSPQRPDFTHIVEQFGYPDCGWFETKNYDPLLMKLKEGQTWQFRLCANPTRSSFKEKDEDTGRGRVFAHVTPEHQKEWLLARADACGFALEKDAFDVVCSQWKKFRKGSDANRKVSLLMATFEGVLTISDAERFKQVLQSGIGREKAYGCGLLTIARHKENPYE